MSIVGKNFELINQSITVLTTPEEFRNGLRKIETMGRICWQSADKNPADNYSEEKTMQFVTMLIGKHHESVLEHCSLSAIITTDRAVTHQLVRHRLCSFSQESQRYCNYSAGKFGNKVQYIKPIWFDKWSDSAKETFLAELESATSTYMKLVQEGRPEEARAVLPNACRTQIGITTNLRELRHILKERCSGAAQAQIRQLALAVREALPAEVRYDIPYKYECGTQGIIDTCGILNFADSIQ
jgi:thymidylate synthase (FAD)